MEHTLDKKSSLNQGVTIFVYLAVLTILEYGLAIFLPAVPLLIVVALVKAGLVAYYYMHIYKLNLEDHGAGHESYDYKTGTNRLGLWLFLLSDSFVFGALLISRFNLLGMERPHLNQLLGLLVTSVLLISSFFMNRAETSIAHGDVKGFLNGTLITIILGAGFVIGVVGGEWQLAKLEDVIANKDVYGGIFYMMTGMHAFHVLTGLIFLGIVYRLGRKGQFSAEQHWGVEAAAVYWHFVDVVWIFFYPALYLIGTIPGLRPAGCFYGCRSQPAARLAEIPDSDAPPIIDIVSEPSGRGLVDLSRLPYLVGSGRGRGRRADSMERNRPPADSDAAAEIGFSTRHLLHHPRRLRPRRCAR